MAGGHAMAPRPLGWYLLLTAALAALGALWWPPPPETARPGRDPHAHEWDRPEATPLPLLALEAAGAVEVVAGGRTHRFEKNERGEWFLRAHRHQDAHAGTHPRPPGDRDPERWREPMRLLGAMRIERRLGPRAGVDLAEVGLVRPQYAVLVYEPGSALPARTVHIGEVAPDTFSRYVLLEPDAEVGLIAAYHIERLAQQLPPEPSRPAPERRH